MISRVSECLLKSSLHLDNIYEKLYVLKRYLTSQRSNFREFWILSEHCQNPYQNS